MRGSRELGRIAGGVRGLHSSFNPRVSISERIFGTNEILKHDLYKPAPYAPEPAIVEPQAPGDVKITTLKNGVRVASQDLGGKVSAMAVFIDASPRYENLSTAGSSFMFEKLAFKGSAKRSRIEMIRDAEALSGSFTCTASRECMVSCAEGFRAKSKDMLELLIESSVFPRVSIDPSSMDADTVRTELSKLKKLLKKDFEDLVGNKDMQMADALHAAAYSGVGLGLPLLIDEKRMQSIRMEELHNYMSLYTGKNIVISACDADHDELVEVAEEMLGGLPAGEKNMEKFPASYTGGEVRLREEGPAEVALGFEGYRWDDAEVVPQCVLNTMMGGGGSFSTGGPGKGLFTRLYSNVLNRHHWVHSAVCTHSLYADSSLMAIKASCDPDMVSDLLSVVSDASKSLATAPTSEELERAKNQTKSTLLMNLDSRVVVCEDIGRQVLNCNKYVSAAEFVERIEKTTAKDVQKIGEKLLASKPSLVLKGELYDAPSFDQITSFVQKTSKLSM